MDFSKITEFVLQAGTECAKANPNLKCITPDYCYISYLDGEYIFSIVDILNYSEEKNGTANSYEEALSEGIKESIKILKENYE